MSEVTPSSTILSRSAIWRADGLLSVEQDAATKPYSLLQYLLAIDIRSHHLHPLLHDNDAVHAFRISRQVYNSSSCKAYTLKHEIELNQQTKYYLEKILTTDIN